MSEELTSNIGVIPKEGLPGAHVGGDAKKVLNVLSRCHTKPNFPKKKKKNIQKYIKKIHKYILLV